MDKFTDGLSVVQKLRPSKSGWMKITTKFADLTNACIVVIFLRSY